MGRGCASKHAGGEEGCLLSLDLNGTTGAAAKGLSAPVQGGEEIGSRECSHP